LIIFTYAINIIFLVVGIAGASASGKSLIASTIYNELLEKVGDDHIGVITEDCYYKYQSQLSMEEREKTNYDHPNALDHDLLCQHLEQLVQGNSVEVPGYIYSVHTRTDNTATMTPKKVIILEGILLLTDPRLRDLMHATVFMDTPLDICLLRRVKRDVEERGRTMESVLKQYQDAVRPMFMQFIEPSKKYADIIVTRGGKNRIAIDVLKAHIALVIVALLALILFVNPNQFKPMIVEQVQKNTGMTLAIEGDISWQFFPSLGFSVGKTELRNPEGFSSPSRRSAC
jgi:uridine kinase